MNFNEKESKQWSRMGPRAMFGQFMLDIAEKNNNLMVLSAGLRRSSGLERFKSKHPEKYLDIGISEQNLIGVAAGLAGSSNGAPAKSAHTIKKTMKSNKAINSI